MELTLIYTIVGFGLAGWSVIANDSVQTLGTFIASKQKWFKWYTLATSASFAMIITISFGWWTHDGDIILETNCNRGIINGSWIAWYDNGEKKLEKI